MAGLFYKDAGLPHYSALLERMLHTILIRSGYVTVSLAVTTASEDNFTAQVARKQPFSFAHFVPFCFRPPGFIKYCIHMERNKLLSLLVGWSSLKWEANGFCKNENDEIQKCGRRREGPPGRRAVVLGGRDQLRFPR